jgi:hypothetical protein
MNRWWTGAAVAALAFGSGTKLVAASIPDAAGNIKGCVNNAGGVVRIVDTAKSGKLGKCITTGAAVLRETEVEWAETGRDGANGEQGPAGGIASIVSGSPSNIVGDPSATEMILAGTLDGHWVSMTLWSECPAGSAAFGRDVLDLPPEADIVRDTATANGRRFWITAIANRTDHPVTITASALSATCLTTADDTSGPPTGPTSTASTTSPTTTTTLPPGRAPGTRCDGWTSQRLDIFAFTTGEVLSFCEPPDTPTGFHFGGGAPTHRVVSDQQLGAGWSVKFTNPDVTTTTVPEGPVITDCIAT